MKYEDLEKTLNKYDLGLNSFADAIGLKARSITTNYKNKPKDLPQYYDRLLDLYIQLQNEKVKNVLVEEKLSFDNDLINCDKVLDKKAQKIAQQKCIENNISISDYLSSLIISNI